MTPRVHGEGEAGRPSRERAVGGGLAQGGKLQHLRCSGR